MNTKQIAQHFGILSMATISIILFATQTENSYAQNLMNTYVENIRQQIDLSYDKPRNAFLHEYFLDICEQIGNYTSSEVCK